MRDSMLDRVGRWARTGVMALAILAIGAAVHNLWASGKPFCEFDPPVMGTCPPITDCTAVCVDHYGQGTVGECIGGECCVCQLR
jgi:hypothetical protein